MTQEHHSSDRSLVEEHALNRLQKVEKEKRKEYKKRPSPFKFSNIIMAIILAVVLISMIVPLFQ